MRLKNSQNILYSCTSVTKACEKQQSVIFSIDFRSSYLFTMNDVGCVQLPNLYWSIGDVTPHCKKNSPVFHFAGDEWVLKFSVSWHQNSEIFFIFLKRLSFNRNIAGVTLVTNTSIVDSSTGRKFWTVTGNIRTENYNKWCIWEQSRCTVNSSVCEGNYNFRYPLQYGFVIEFTLKILTGGNDILAVTQTDESREFIFLQSN